VFRQRNLKRGHHVKNRILTWQMLFKSTRASGLRPGEMGGFATIRFSAGRPRNRTVAEWLGLAVCGRSALDR
jgi:hypothetical protein